MRFRKSLMRFFFFSIIQRMHELLCGEFEELCLKYRSI
jgi:hypothetical protein